MNPFKKEDILQRANMGLSRMGSDIGNLVQKVQQGREAATAAAAGAGGGAAAGGAAAAGGGGGGSGSVRGGSGAISEGLGSGPVLAGKSHEDISREDLLGLVMKSSKRLKALEARSTQLAAVHKKVLLEKKALLEFANEVSVDMGLQFEAHPDGQHAAAEAAGDTAAAAAAVGGEGGAGVGAAGPGPEDVSQLRSSWRKKDAERNSLIRELQQSYQEAVRAKDAEVHKVESRWRREVRELQAKLEAEQQLRHQEQQERQASREAVGQQQSPPTEGQEEQLVIQPPAAPPLEQESSSERESPAHSDQQKQPQQLAIQPPTLDRAASGTLGGSSEDKALVAGLRKEVVKLEKDIEGLQSERGRMLRAADLSQQELSLSSAKAKAEAKATLALRDRLEAAQEDLAQAAAQAEELREESKALASRGEDQLIAMQMQVRNAVKAEENAKAEITLRTKEAQDAKLVAAAAEEMKQQLDTALGQREDFKQRAGRAETKLQQLVVQQREEHEELQGLRGEVATLRPKAARCEALEKEVTTAQAGLADTANRADDYRKQAEELRSLLVEKDGNETRLKAEKLDAAQQYGDRVALIASLEDKVEELQSLNKGLRAEATALSARQQELSKQQKEQQQRQLAIQEEAERGRAEEGKARREEVQRLKSEHEQRLSEVTKESSKKASLARRMLDEREKQVGALTAKLNVLEAEVASGGHSDRKIMELAAAQAQRGAGLQQLSEMREEELRSAQQTLLELRQELEEQAREKASMMEQLGELGSIQRREGVNMEYLKNVMVKYMSLASGCSERRHLIRVIATVLEFTEEEVQRVSQEGPWDWCFAAKPPATVVGGRRAVNHNPSMQPLVRR